MRVSTGETALHRVSCRNLTSNGSTGEISLHHVVSGGSLSITRSTGDIRFDDCDAATLLIETDTGDVSGRLLSDKVFITHTDTGRVKVPNTSTGGRCEIRTDTGDIQIIT